MNVVMAEGDKFIEVQGTAEREPFSRNDLDEMLALAAKGVGELIQLQRSTLGLD
jgi:ribonuclease PH